MAPARLWTYTPTPAFEKMRCACWATGDTDVLRRAAAVSASDHFFQHAPKAYPTFVLDRYKPIYWRIASHDDGSPKLGYVRCVLEVSLQFYQTQDEAETWLLRRLNRRGVSFDRVREMVTFPIIDPRTEYVVVVMTRFEVDVNNTSLTVNALVAACRTTPGLGLLYVDGYDTKSGRRLPVLINGAEDFYAHDSSALTVQANTSLSISHPPTTLRPVVVEPEGSNAPCTTVANLTPSADEGIRPVDASFNTTLREPLVALDLNISLPDMQHTTEYILSAGTSFSSMPGLSASSSVDFHSPVMPISPTHDNLEVVLVAGEADKTSKANKENIPCEEEHDSVSENESLIDDVSDSDCDADESDAAHEPDN